MKNKKICLLTALLLFCFWSGLPAKAENKTALTITPPIIKNNVNPGQIWKSYLKVVNNNPKEIKAYIELVNFESANDTGTVKLNYLNDEFIKDNDQLINNWVIIDRGPIAIPANQSVEIPFIVDVPELISPGDHHIAILVGTRPTDSESGGSAIRVSSMLGSLLLLNVNGDVEETGLVREFTTDKKYYDGGDAKFTLRFQNTGNTILQPQGEIKIFNMQKKEVGSVYINHKTNTGNVFPKDTRLSEYVWPVPDSLLEMGRYRAELILTFGNQAKETTTQVIYFWVIKWKPVLIVSGSFLLFIILITLLIRRYVRKAIQETELRMGLNNGANKSSSQDIHAVVDLKGRPSAGSGKKTAKSKGFGWRTIRLALIVIVIALLIISLIFFYFYLKTKKIDMIPIEEVSVVQDVIGLEQEREIEIIEGSSVDIKKAEEVLTQADEIEPENLNKEISIRIQNGSGQAGIAGKAQKILGDSGFTVEQTGNAKRFDYKVTVMEYKESAKPSAEYLAKKIGVVPVYELNSDMEADLLIILGTDFK